MHTKFKNKFTYPLFVALGAILIFIAVTAIYSQVYPYYLLKKNIRNIQDGTEYDMYSSIYDMEIAFSLYGIYYPNGRNEAFFLRDCNEEGNVEFSCKMTYEPETGIQLDEEIQNEEITVFTDFFEMISTINLSDVHFRNVSNFWAYNKWYFIFEYEYEGNTGILGIRRNHPEHMIIQPDGHEFGEDIFASISLHLYDPNNI